MSEKQGTKSKIIAEAVKQFNKQGYAVTNLFEIANTLGISRGNLTYHFKDKDALLEVIANEMWEKIETERSKSRQFPSFENLHKEVQLYYKFQKEYAFIFLDHHVLSHPLIHSKFKDMTRQTISDIKASIAFSVSLGNVKRESVPGTYNNIAFITWMLTFFWHSQQIVTGDKNKIDGEKLIWSIMIPHFTPKGLQSFKKFFGESYYNSLGDPFKLDMADLMSF